MINIPKLTKDEIFQKLEYLRQLKEFDQEIYPEIDKIIQGIGNGKREGYFSDEDIKEISHYYGREFLANTLQGMALLKKFGYAGDFLMIDRIYTGDPPENSFYKSWDNYFQNQAAPSAVRNRKEYFKTIVTDRFSDCKELNILNVASGPARDLAELFAQKPKDFKLKVTCVEMDKFAIEYAKKVTHNFNEDIEYVNKNIFKFETEQKYDIVWSAGLFDYFDDKGFLFVLNKFKNWVKPKGEIVIGNFNSDHNPTRDYMEIFGEWFLNHRTESELINLGNQVGFNKDQISVNREEQNVNLFLHIKKNTDQNR